MWKSRKHERAESAPEIKDFGDEASASAPPRHIGAVMRRAREAQGLALADVARELHIRESYLHAIEEAQFDRLPAAVYAVGFVRSYAEHVGLDSDGIVRRFKDEAEGLPARPALVVPEPAPETRVPGGAIVVVSVLAAGLAYGGWTYLANQSRTAVEAPVVEAPPARTADPQPVDPRSTLAPRAARVDPSAPPRTAPPRPAPAAGETDDPDQAQLAPPPDPLTRAGLRDPLTRQPPNPSSANAATFDEEQRVPRPALRSPADDPRLAAAPPGRIVIRAIADSWLQIGDGKEFLFQQILRAGDSFRAPDRPGLRFDTGNAGGLENLVDGRPAPPLGPSGAVRRNIPLDPDRLIAGDHGQR